MSVEGWIGLDMHADERGDLLLRIAHFDARLA